MVSFQRGYSFLAMRPYQTTDERLESVNTLLNFSKSFENVSRFWLSEDDDDDDDDDYKDNDDDIVINTEGITVLRLGF